MSYSGDFNCKCHWWGYKDSDSLGRDIQSLVNNDNVSFLNNKETATLLKVRIMFKQIIVPIPNMKKLKSKTHKKNKTVVSDRDII